MIVAKHVHTDNFIVDSTDKHATPSDRHAAQLSEQSRFDTFRKKQHIVNKHEDIFFQAKLQQLHKPPVHLSANYDFALEPIFARSPNEDRTARHVGIQPIYCHKQHCILL